MPILSTIINLTLSVNEPLATVIERSIIKYNRHILFVLNLIRKKVFEIYDRGEIVRRRLEESPRKRGFEIHCLNILQYEN